MITYPESDLRNFDVSESNFSPLTQEIGITLTIEKGYINYL